MQACLLPLAVGHLVVWPTEGVYTVPKGTKDYDRIVVLEPSDTIVIPSAGKFAATPVFGTKNEVDFKDRLYNAECVGDIFPPDNTEFEDAIFRPFEQFIGFAPWRIGENYTGCMGDATLKNIGNTRFLVFLGGNNDQTGVADLLAQGGINLWFHGTWTGKAWTFPTCVVASLLFVGGCFWVVSRNGPQIMVSKERFYLYAVAIAGFLAAAAEGIIHTAISAQDVGGATRPENFPAAYAIVIGTNVGAIAITLATMYARYDWSHYWGVVELGVGFAYMLLWIGLYVGPVAVMAAAIVRLYQGKDAKLVAFTI